MAFGRGQWIVAVVAAAALLAIAQRPAPSADEAVSNSRVALEVHSTDSPTAADSDVTAAASSRPAASAESRPLLRSGARKTETETDGKSIGPPSGGTAGDDWWRMVAALALVLGLILALRWLLRRLGGGRGSPGASGEVELLSRTPLSARHSVLLVRVGKRVLVVGVGGDNLRTLTEIEEPEQVSQLLGATRRTAGGSPSGGSGFTRALSNWRGRMAAADELPGSPGADLRTPAGGLADRVRTMIDKIRSGGAGGKRR